MVTTLFDHVFVFFLNYWLILFNSCGYCTKCTPITELVIPVGIPSKGEKTETEIKPATAEAKLFNIT